MDISSSLLKIGLTKSETKIYLYLLEQGISTPPQIAKGTKIQRTNTYNVLRSLTDKSLIKAQTVSSRKAYIARDPETLVTEVEQKKKAITKLVPELRMLYKAQVHKPQIQFFEGWEEVKNVYISCLEAKQIISAGSPGQLMQTDPKFFAWYNKALSKKKVIYYDIINTASKKTIPETKKFLGQLYQAKVIPAKFQSIPTDILVWNDKVAIISLDQPIFGTVLVNANVAKSFEIIFSLLWEQL